VLIEEQHTTLSVTNQDALRHSPLRSGVHSLQEFN